MTYILAIIIPYLIGSIPFSYIFSRLKGIDLKNSGTKNIGATNALASAGVRIGIISMLFDVFKGFFTLYFSFYLGLNMIQLSLAGFFVVLGHNYPFYLKFKGGKGVATTCGVFFAINPLIILILILLWLIFLLITRYFILSTLITFLFLPVLTYYLMKDFFILAIGLTVLAFLSHFPDLINIFQGKGKIAFSQIKDWYTRKKESK
jgi:glycerol-3-phosphate acyltransferase PlsY